MWQLRQRGPCFIQFAPSLWVPCVQRGLKDLTTTGKKTAVGWQFKHRCPNVIIILLWMQNISSCRNICGGHNSKDKSLNTVHLSLRSENTVCLMWKKHINQSDLPSLQQSVIPLSNFNYFLLSFQVANLSKPTYSTQNTCLRRFLKIDSRAPDDGNYSFVALGIESWRDNVWLRSWCRI